VEKSTGSLLDNSFSRRDSRDCDKSAILNAEINTISEV
jgi:hypothetical protein